MTSAPPRLDEPPPTPSWDSPRPARRFQSLLVTLAVLLLLPAVGSTVLRLAPPTDDGTAMVASFISYGLPAYALALVLLVVALVRARRRAVLAVLSAVTAVLMAGHLAWLGPFFVPDQRPATTAPFHLMSLNMYNGTADPQQVYDAAQQADVVVLVEATPFALKALKELGWSQRFPYSVGDLDETISDTAIYSRLPLSRGTLLGDTSFQQWLTTVEVPGVGPVRLIAAHPCNPYCGGGRWYREHEELREAARANSDHPLIVAGDFNAVDDHGPMQQLRRDGLESATDIVGAGWMPTWPANRWFPPLIPIDHVLVNRDLTAVSIQTIRIAGTDHLGLLAELAGTG